MLAKKFNNLNFQCSLVKLYLYTEIQYNFKNNVKELSDTENVHNILLKERRKLPDERRKLSNSMICDPK